MPSFTNIGMLSQLKELIQQYVRSYVVTNSAGDAIYEVRNINPQEMSEAAKSLICLYEFAADPFPQGNTLCEECTNLFFRVAIRRMEREGKIWTMENKDGNTVYKLTYQFKKKN